MIAFYNNGARYATAVNESWVGGTFTRKVDAGFPFSMTFLAALW